LKTYGTIEYDHEADVFKIRCQPHVAIRIKRVFSKINTYEYGTLRLSATPENARDLEWFLERYPMDAPAEVIKDLSNQHKERALVIEKLLAGYTGKPFPMKLPAREYQALAANLWLTSGGLLLADDVGTGKTVSAIAGLTDPRLLPALIVCPTHLPPQWEEQIHKFTDMTVHRLKQATPYDLTKSTKGAFPDVVISNYHKLAGWAETIAPCVKSIVFDEVQDLRHQGSNKYQAAKHIADAVNWKIGLSATPIYGYGGEIFNVLNVLCPDQLGTWEEFAREWVSYSFGDKPKIKDPKAFGVYAREAGLMLRRTRIEVRRELPEITVVPHTIECDEHILEKMQGKAIELAKLILKQGQDFKGQKMQSAGEFDMLMRQATGISKAPYVAEFVKLLIEENDEPVVLFGWHRAVYEIWLEKLAAFNPVMYTGSESPTQKEAAKQAFVSGKSKVMIISLRAGAGLDGLQDICHIGVVGELDWAQGVLEQCIGRIHRDGQDEPVIVYYLLSDSGSDPIMSDVLGIKKQQLEGIRDPNQDLVSKLQINSNYIRDLAAKFLTDNGIELPKSEETPVLSNEGVTNDNET
jgi:SNF2 family DNA or RNA helicase